MTSARRPPASLTFVVVVFEAELDLLQLQAASFARHVDPAIVDKVIIVDQSRPEISARIRRRVLGAYDQLADRVEFVRSSPGDDGWVSQQVVKLAVADRVTTSHYVALDAKTHAVGPVDARTFFAADGRAHLRWYRFAGHPMESRVRRTAAWLGLPDDVADQELPATTTPFTFVTREVRELVEATEAREQAPFATVFEDAGLIEFPLYSLWLLQRGSLDELYDRVPLPCPTVWPSLRSLDDLRAVLSNVDEDPPSSFLAVHRAALARMSPRASLVLARWWTDRDVFAHLPAALWFGVRARIRIIGTRAWARARKLVRRSRR